MIKEANDAHKGVKLHSRSHITLLVRSFDSFKEVILDVGEYTRKVSYDSLLAFLHILSGNAHK